MTFAASTPAVSAHHDAAAQAERQHEPTDCRAYAEHRDRQARESLLRAHLPLANAIARRFDRGDRVPLEDLQQIAALGLIKALDRFDPGNGAAFSSFAVPTIEGEIRRYFRDFTWTVRPPRGLQERVSASNASATSSHATSAAVHRRRARPTARLHDRGHPRRRRSRPGPQQRLPRPPTLRRRRRRRRRRHARRAARSRRRGLRRRRSHRHARRPARHAVRTRRARSAPTRPRGPHPSRNRPTHRLLPNAGVAHPARRPHPTHRARANRRPSGPPTATRTRP